METEPDIWFMNRTDKCRYYKFKTLIEAYKFACYFDGFILGNKGSIIMKWTVRL